MKLVVSIVTFRSDPELFVRTLSSLASAIEYAKSQFSGLSCELYVVENEDVQQYNLKQAECFFQAANESVFDEVVITSAGGNLGYGSGHNASIESAVSDYHLILNPDALLYEDAISEGLKFLCANEDTVLVAPQVFDGHGRALCLCRRYPSVFDLFLRGFAPARLKSYFHERLEKYEMSELRGTKRPVKGIDIVSGCCMLMPTSALNVIGGFDVRFFLYFEDYDLSLRARKVGRVAYVPSMKIAHYGGGASRKGFRHIYLFISSAVKFYSKHHWRWF